MNDFVQNEWIKNPWEWSFSYIFIYFTITWRTGWCLCQLLTMVDADRTRTCVHQHASCYGSIFIHIHRLSWKLRWPCAAARVTGNLIWAPVLICHMHLYKEKVWPCSCPYWNKSSGHKTTLSSSPFLADLSAVVPVDQLVWDTLQEDCGQVGIPMDATTLFKVCRFIQRSCCDNVWFVVQTKQLYSVLS